MEEIQPFLSRKLERWKQLVALLVGEKLWMPEEMVAVTKAISAIHPSVPAYLVRSDVALAKAGGTRP
jgi:hypothetical protein